MNFFQRENNLLFFIRYGAIITIVIFSIIITSIFITQKKIYTKNNIKYIEKKYLSHHEIMIKNLVNKIYTIIKVEKEFSEKNLQKQLKQELDQAFSITNTIYSQKLQNKLYSKEKTIEYIKEILRSIEFNNGLGYIFIYNTDGKIILNTKFPDIEDKNFLNYKDKNGVFLFKEINKILENKDESYYEWYWEKPQDNKQYRKIGYFKKFEQLDIIIGTGDYFDELQNDIKSNILKKINSLKLIKPENIFIYNLDGTCLANPNKELIGVNRYNSKNKDGRYELKELLEYTNKNKKGYFEYKGAVVLNNENITNEKIFYVKLFEDWKWMIGSSFYMEELNNIIEEKILSIEKSSSETINKILNTSIIITFILIIFSFYISKNTSIIFKNYKQKIKEEINNTIEKEKLLIQQSKMATMGEMIGNIAHQWKQPLSLISMSNGLLKINQESDNFMSKAEINEAIENIENSVSNLSTTIDDFRNFFNPNKKKKEFYIVDTLNKTLKLINSQFKNNNIKIVKNIKEVKLLGYQNELLQVLINLIKNAKDELIKIDDKEKRYLFLDTYEKNNDLIIEIKDNAGGIPNDIINNIFDPYFTTKGDNEGTGIGLYMSKNIIEHLNGKIDVRNIEYNYENQHYKGAAFTVLIPKIV